MDEAHFPENSVSKPEVHNVSIPVEKAWLEDEYAVRAWIG